MKSKIKAIIFDVGGVLQLEKKKLSTKRGAGVHNFVARQIGITIDQYFDAIDTIYAATIIGKISEKKATDLMAKNLKIPEKKLKNLYLKAYKKNFNLNKGLLEYARKLKKKQGYKIAILSDQWYLSKKAVVPRIFYKIFDPLIISCDVGMRKPDSKIYSLLLKKIGAKGKEVIFVDNQKWNISPARKLGMKTILFKNNKQTMREIKKILK